MLEIDVGRKVCDQLDAIYGGFYKLSFIVIGGDFIYAGLDGSVILDELQIEYGFEVCLVNQDQTEGIMVVVLFILSLMMSGVALIYAGMAN
ncbi:MAG: hypothetical protein EZS28_001313 [Streblomastix strix]|uniref:Uncharacterized protein n=1 Tax=Streblomastix strix TaxID=222440 RepID=A0A5J4X9G3_9EUKA|nr:MAG: hypothetical protein EZS28_001313 [Streblomastix strix]